VHEREATELAVAERIMEVAVAAAADMLMETVGCHSAVLWVKMPGLGPC
jgi:hypothetical protein